MTDVTKPVGDPPPTCPTEAGEPCGTCLPDLAAQEAGPLGPPFDFDFPGGRTS